MTRAERVDGTPNAQQTRGAQKRAGTKLLRMWVPDPSTPEIQADLARQAVLLKGTSDEEEATRFIETVFEWPEP